MSMKKSTVAEVARIAAEVKAMAEGVILEIDNQESWHYDGKGNRLIKYPNGPAPDNETHPGYAKSTAALKRRSMDLTRALAEMRRNA